MGAPRDGTSSRVWWVGIVSTLTLVACVATFFRLLSTNAPADEVRLALDIGALASVVGGLAFLWATISDLLTGAATERMSGTVSWLLLGVAGTLSFPLTIFFLRTAPGTHEAGNLNVAWREVVPRHARHDISLTLGCLVGFALLLGLAGAALDARRQRGVLAFLTALAALALIFRY